MISPPSLNLRICSSLGYGQLFGWVNGLMRESGIAENHDKKGDLRDISQSQSERRHSKTIPTLLWSHDCVEEIHLKLCTSFCSTNVAAKKQMGEKPARMNTSQH